MTQRCNVNMVWVYVVEWSFVGYSVGVCPVFCVVHRTIDSVVAIVT